MCLEWSLRIDKYHYLFLVSMSAAYLERSRIDVDGCRYNLRVIGECSCMEKHALALLK